MIKNLSELLENPKDSKLKALRKVLLEALENALKKVDLKSRFESLLPFTPSRPSIIAIGKASFKMFSEFTSLYGYKRGIIVSNVQVSKEFDGVEFIRAGHPLPDDGSVFAGKRVVEFLNELEAEDEVIFLISGGGSAMLELPRIPLQDLVYVNQLLLSCGADIEEINTVRKHLSWLKGGQILKYLKGKALAFLMSDVIKDRVDIIASGSTVCDNSTFKDAYLVLRKYDLWEKVPRRVKEVILQGLEGKVEETLKDCRWAEEKVKNFVILKNADLLQTLSSLLSYNFQVFNLGSDFHVDVEEMADFLYRKAMELLEGRVKNFVIVAGGEVKVRVINPSGKGGRNQDLALRMAIKLRDLNAKFVFLSFGTDGIDGNTDSAGAISDSKSYIRALSLGLSPQFYLEQNDSHTLFKALGDLIITGPTGINVKDVYILAVTF